MVQHSEIREHMEVMGSDGGHVGRVDHVLGDEYQDVNQIQADIVRLLCPDGVGLTVVGDDAQAVYGFRGASARSGRISVSAVTRRPPHPYCLL